MGKGSSGDEGAAVSPSALDGAKIAARNAGLAVASLYKEMGPEEKPPVRQQVAEAPA